MGLARAIQRGASAGSRLVLDRINAVFCGGVGAARRTWQRFSGQGGPGLALADCERALRVGLVDCDEQQELQPWARDLQ